MRADPVPEPAAQGLYGIPGLPGGPGPEEILLGLQDLARDAEELKDIAAELYSAARAAGI
ncbi:hypothetical protein [Streptomyces nigrescens]|uniref:hypothetical protein n=1 Tax=Streptomyces nigrescens TaxID=1920 RepID=UPI003F4D4D4E